LADAGFVLKGIVKVKLMLTS